MAKKIILTDVDGVLLRWEEGFSRWMTSKNFGSPVDLKQYSQAKRYGISQEKADELVKQFNESAWIRYLNPMPLSEKIVEKFRVQGFEFKCITSLSTDKFAKQAREDNLKDLFQESMIEVVCLETGSPKDEALAKYAKINPGAYWIEDKPENAIAGMKAGFKSILLTQKYNEDFECPEGMIRCKDWNLIFDTIHVFKL